MNYSVEVVKMSVAVTVNRRPSCLSAPRSR